MLPLKRIRRVSELLQIDPTDNHVAERRVRRRGGGDHPWVAALPWMAGHQNSHTVCGPDIHAIRGGPVRARIDAVANEAVLPNIADIAIAPRPVVQAASARRRASSPF